MVCFSSYALITKQAAAEDVRFFGQKAFGSVGSREREREKKDTFQMFPYKVVVLST